MSTNDGHRKVEQDKFEAPDPEQTPAGSSIKEATPSNVTSAPSSLPSSTSYVYPVRSLLSGIQPAPPDQLSPPAILGTIGPTPTAKNMSHVTAQLKREKGSKASGTRSAKTSVSETSNPSLPKDSPQSPFVPLSGESYFTHPAGSTSTTQDVSSSTSLTPQAKSKLDEKTQEGTIKIDSAAGVPTGPSSESPTSTENQIEKSGQRVLILPGDRDADEYDPRHPEPISSAGADAISTAYTSPSLKVPKPMQAAQSDEPYHSNPIDFSHSGIVHLPPVSSRSASERGSSVSGGSLISSRKPRDNVQSPFSGSGSDPWGRSDRGKSSAGEGNQSGLSGTDSAGDAARQTPSSTNMSSSSELVTFRFEHVLDENGFHVLTGREGVLTKCEDEVCIHSALFICLLS